MKFPQYGPNERSVGRWVGRSVGPQYILLLTLFSYTPLRYVRNVAREDIIITMRKTTTATVMAIAPSDSRREILRRCLARAGLDTAFLRALSVRTNMRNGQCADRIQLERQSFL